LKIRWTQATARFQRSSWPTLCALCQSGLSVISSVSYVAERRCRWGQTSPPGDDPTAVASDRRAATDLAAAASIALAAGFTADRSYLVCWTLPSVARSKRLCRCISLLLQFMSFCRHFALLSIVLSSRVSRVSFCRRSSVSGSLSCRKILL